MSGYGFPTVQRDDVNEKDHRRLMADAINRIMVGKINAAIDITLASSATNTTINDLRLSAQSVILLMPLTANAATAYIAGIWASDQGTGTAKLNHASSAATDQSFRAIILG